MEVKCYKCNYPWNYKREKEQICCPNCGCKIYREKAERHARGDLILRKRNKVKVKKKYIPVNHSQDVSTRKEEIFTSNKKSKDTKQEQSPSRASPDSLKRNERNIEVTSLSKIAPELFKENPKSESSKIEEDKEKASEQKEGIIEIEDIPYGPEIIENIPYR